MMTTEVMDETTIRSMLMKIMRGAAPDMVEEKLDPNRNLREQTKISPQDYTVFLEGVTRVFDVPIPDLERTRLTTLNALTRYVKNRLETGAAHKTEAV